MKSPRIAAVGLAGVFLCHAAGAFADTESDRIKRLEDQIKLLQQQIEQLKKDQTARDRETAAAAAAKPAAIKEKAGQPMPGGAAAPAAGLKITGDVTTRFDLTGVHARELGIIPEGDQGALRGRFRLRLQTPVSQRSEAELYLVNGINTSPTAGFTAFTDAFRGKTISFGRASINYYFGDKANLKTPSLIFGKMQNPFWRGELGNFASEIVWDNDVNPEGIATRLPIVNNKHVSVTNTTGFFTLNLPNKQLFTGLTTDTYQIGTQFKVDSGLFHGSFNYYVFDNLNSGLLVPHVGSDGYIDTTPAQAAWLLRGGQGLQTSNGHYYYASSAPGFGANTFNIVNLNVQLAPKVRPNQLQPFLHWEYLNNGGVKFDNEGYGITLGVNKSRLADGRSTSRGDYTAWVTYRDVDADATLATIADSDLGGGTDYKGYQIGFAYRVENNLGVRLAWHDYQGAPLKTNKTTRLFMDIIRFF